MIEPKQPKPQIEEAVVQKIAKAPKLTSEQIKKLVQHQKREQTKP